MPRSPSTNGPVGRRAATPGAADRSVREAERRLAEANLPLVHYAVAEVAQRVPRHVGRDTLISAGLYGLAQAIRAFDPERGSPFARYANRRIQGALLDELRSSDWAARTVRSQARALQAATERLTVRGGAAPDLDAVAAEMGLDVEAVRRLQADLHRATILDLDDLPEDTHGSWLAGPTEDDPLNVMLSRERAGYLLDAVEALPDRLRHVVVSYFFEGRAMQDIASELGVSESRVSQLRAEAQTLLYQGITAQLEPDALPREAHPDGRGAERRRAYYERVAAGSDYRRRLSPQDAAARFRQAAG